MKNCVSDIQKYLHIGSELLAVCVLTPWLFKAAQNSNTPHKERLYFMAYGTLLVDGFLLINWLSK